MKILLIADYPFDESTSMPLYAEMLRGELSRRGHQVTLRRITTFFGKLRRPGSLGKWLGYLDKYILFPMQLRAMKHQGWDVIHVCDHSYSMYLAPLTGPVTPSITAHDLLAVFAAEGRFGDQKVISSTGRVQQRWIRHGLQHAKRVICVSEKTAEDMSKIGCTGKLTVIYNPLNRAYIQPSSETLAVVRTDAGLTPTESYLLHVGSNSWYKNRPGVLRIFAALRSYPEFAKMRLLMAGRRWSEEMHALAQQLNLGDAAVEVIEPSDAELWAFNAGAEALLYPSLAEGFGWPVLESQACGCPVITSNRAPMTEVAGGAAILVDPENPVGAAAEIARRWPERDRLRELGRINLHRFERAAIIDKYEQFFAASAQQVAASAEGQR